MLLFSIFSLKLKNRNKNRLHRGLARTLGIQSQLCVTELKVSNILLVGRQFFQKVIWICETDTNLWNWYKISWFSIRQKWSSVTCLPVCSKEWTAWLFKSQTLCRLLLVSWFHATKHPDLSVRTPEVLSVVCAYGINEVIVSKWYSELLDRREIQDIPSHIWNCDESWFQIFCE